MTTTAAIELQDTEYTEQLSLPVWRKLFAYARPYRAAVLGLVAGALMMAVVEAVFPLITRAAVNEAIERGPDARLMLYVVLTGAGALAFALAGAVFIRLAGWLSSTVSHDLRQRGFEHLQELSFAFYDRRPAGWLVSRLTGDCDRLSNILAWGMCLDLIWGSCTILGVSAVVLAMNWRLGLWVLAVVPVLAAVSLFFQRRILRLSRAIRKQNSAITAGYSECIAAVRTTKTLVREEPNLREFQSKTGQMYADSVRNALLSAAFFPLMLTIGSVGAALALWRGGRPVVLGLPGAPDVGTLIALVNYAGWLIWPVWEMARVLADLQNAQAAAERVLGLIDTEPQVKDTPQALSAMARVRAAGGPGPGQAVDGLADDIRKVEFRHVSFHYVSGQPVLEDFNLAAAAGQTVALVGPTGGGKTTIVNLLGRFYEPTGGEILLDGVEYRLRGLRWLQSKLGVVLQEPHLFSGTIRENIRYGRLDASDQEIEAAARLVCAHDFILKQEQGYDTQVGENGVKLSTGQRQLISFARAVLADPRIFIMDEATSSIDTETEQHIQRGLTAVLAGRISFIIAHRLSTIRRADRIVVIEAGRIVEQGTHRELIARRGRYYDLYTTQFAEERTSEVLARR